MNASGKLQNTSMSVLCALVTFCSLAAPAVHSDDVKEVTAASVARPSSRAIEEVIVTATKRESSLQETGIAITVLGSEQMKFQNLSDLEDMQNSIPGLSVGTVMGTPIINVRGIGLNFITGLGQPGVATHYDGIYIPRNGSTTTATVDLDRVEVLRGPQGTLYGRNATGGSVNFIAKRPALEFGAGLTIGAGDYARKFYEAYIEGPLFSDNLAMRAYVKQDHFDGYGINEVNGRDVGDNNAAMGRLAFTYTTSEILDIYGSYARRDDHGSYPFTTALSTARSLGGKEYPKEDHTFRPYNTKGLIQPESDRETEIGNITITLDFDNYTLKSASGYVAHNRIESNPIAAVSHYIANINHTETSEAWAQEFNLSAKWFDDRLNWLIGAYYMVDKGASPFHSTASMDEISPIPTATGLVLHLSPYPITKETAEAAFLDGSLSILDSLRLIFGLRISKENHRLDQTLQNYVEDTKTQNPVVEQATMAFISETGLMGETCNHEVSDKTYASTDPKAGIEWDVTGDAMLYIQYQTAFKSGGYNITNSCSQTFDPELISSYEIGVKSSWMDGNLILNAAAFKYDYRDYQVQKAVGFSSVIENAASATTHGAELEINFAPAAWISVDSALSFLDATYENYMSRDGFRNTSLLQADAPLEDLSGNQLSRSPKYTANFGVNFSMNVERFGIGVTRLRIDGFYSDDFYFREFNRPIERQNKYTTYNAFLSLESNNAHFSVDFFVKNINDERYLAGQLPIDTIYYYGGYYAPPRTVGASLSVSLQ